MENAVLKQLLTRRSVREFTGESVREEDLELILKAAQQAPSSVNAQQVSLVITRNKETIQKIAEITGGQPQVAGADVFITFIIDFNRTAEACRLAGETQAIEQSAEGLMVGALDAGIMVASLQAAAESLGYGTTTIGGIRKNPQAMIDLLNLPKKTFPVVGTIIGVPNPEKFPQIKPRVPLKSFAMRERYDSERVLEGVLIYDKALRLWWDEQGMASMPAYVNSTAGFYKQIYYPYIWIAFENQGFCWVDEQKNHA